ncbi:MAG: hypothetical protein RL208_432 [Pseudomonadota bacterium]|jgi:hypothetical protein
MFNRIKAYKKMRQFGKRVNGFSQRIAITKEKQGKKFNFTGMQKSAYIRLKPYNIIDLLIVMKVYKKIALVKVMCILLPFCVLSIIDGLFVSVLMSGFNILLCAVVFWSLAYDENYLYIQKRYNIITILIAILINVFIILIGHYYVANLVKRYILL